jgi:hypothetical protein
MVRHKSKMGPQNHVSSLCVCLLLATKAARRPKKSPLGSGLFGWNAVTTYTL